MRFYGSAEGLRQQLQTVLMSTANVTWMVLTSLDTTRPIPPLLLKVSTAPTPAPVTTAATMPPEDLPGYIDFVCPGLATTP